jgi:hypothetical protein
MACEDGLIKFEQQIEFLVFEQPLPNCVSPRSNPDPAGRLPLAVSLGISDYYHFSSRAGLVVKFSA